MQRCLLLVLASTVLSFFKLKLSGVGPTITRGQNERRIYALDRRRGFVWSANLSSTYTTPCGRGTGDRSERYPQAFRTAIPCGTPQADLMVSQAYYMPFTVSLQPSLWAILF
ncbi:hypothetical protein OF83DRAFT_760433 [Amylostereum chailletii]|nr:hypothetical protein OF83DRAFT_760433 [Amylostereum chailletii]